MISAKAPQQTQEIGSKKVLGAYPAHTLKCFPGHFGAPHRRGSGPLLYCFIEGPLKT